MPLPAYADTTLDTNSPPAARDRVTLLQTDLRRLGYYAALIDGAFGEGTARAVSALQHDLLHNDGASRGGDGRAAVRVLDYNRGRVGLVDGVATPALAACIGDMLDDPAFCKVPASAAPAEDNRKVREQVAALTGLPVPVPFLLAIFRQESGLQHYRVPSAASRDAHVVVGLDRNADARHIITSRGYGMGQYTIFHHPPRQEELAGFIQNAAGNVSRAVGELQDKFAHFVLGASSGLTADDRAREHGTGPLRTCAYAPGDARYLRDCANCARKAGLRDIKAGEPVFEGAKLVFQPTEYYKAAEHPGTPVRAAFPCDWPYAVRRYNGSGVNSYHYQAIVLGNLLKE